MGRSPLNAKRHLKMLELTESAVEHARLVPDVVLRKLHPQLVGPWRDLYQQSLELRIRSLRTMDYQAEVLSTQLHDEFADWWNHNNSEIHVPAG